MDPWDPPPSPPVLLEDLRSAATYALLRGQQPFLPGSPAPDLWRRAYRLLAAGVETELAAFHAAVGLRSVPCTPGGPGGRWREVTLAVYEAPAARHAVDEWRERLAVRISTWTSGSLGLDWVELDGGTVLVLCVPVSKDGSDARLLEAAVATLEAWAEAGTAAPLKLLHFGKVPLGDPGYVAVVNLLTPFAAGTYRVPPE